MSFMSRKEAKDKIATIIAKGKPIKSGISLPIRKGTTFEVYEIPLEYLVPNMLNDRIAWKIREFEAANKRKLSNEREDDVEYVYQLILEESPNENEKTLKDLAEKGQLVDGIITNEGVIIDGNRRATLLRELFKGKAVKYSESVEDFRFFKAIVLNEDIDEREIMALETRIQIGADRIVDYNPINIYIKIDNLTKAGYNDKQIANYMNISDSVVKTKREIFSLMNEYLEVIGKTDFYTLLDGLEDQFISTRIVFKKMDNGTYATHDWDYKDSDVADFKQVCYDFMRAKFEGKKYRDILIGKPNKSDGVFIKKNVWTNFYENHENIVRKNDPQNEADWQLLGKNQFNKNLNNARTKIKDTLTEKNISSLIEDINNKVRSLTELINGHETMTNEDHRSLKEINNLIWALVRDFKG